MTKPNGQLYILGEIVLKTSSIAVIDDLAPPEFSESSKRSVTRSAWCLCGIVQLDSGIVQLVSVFEELCSLTVSLQNCAA